MFIIILMLQRRSIKDIFIETRLSLWYCVM